MFARLSSLALCLALVSVSCQNQKSTPLIDLDPSSGNVLVDPTVEFDGIPEYIDDTNLVFKVKAKNEVASSFVYSLLHGQDLSCDNAGDWKAGSFNTHIREEDTHAHGDRLLCIKGVDADGRLASVYVSNSLKKNAPQPATANVDVAFSIAGGMMSVSKPATSSATGFKWCVINTDAGVECPMPNNDEDSKYADSDVCIFTDGESLPQDNIDLGIGGLGGNDEFFACVVGIGSGKQSLVMSDVFTNGNQQPVTGGEPDPAEQGVGQQPSYPANDGKLVSTSPETHNIGYYVIGKIRCNTMPFFKNSGTEEITVKFDYLNDSGIQKERRTEMFSEMVYQVYPTANHIQVREALYDSYCRRGELGAGKIIRSGDTFKLPAGHQVITVLKQKDPTSMNQRVKYFNDKGYACIEMRLTDLNNNTELNKYRCARRTELELYMGMSNKLTRDSNGEYNVELSRHEEKGNRHLRLTVVNATIEKAIAAGYPREYTENLYKNDMRWKLVGDPDQNVPAWLYYFGANFSKKIDGVVEQITDENQFQFGLRKKQIRAGAAQMPAAGTTYRLLILSNSLSDKPCQRSRAPSGGYEYVANQNNAQGEDRKTKRESFWFCPREDVLNITIVDP